MAGHQGVPYWWLYESKLYESKIRTHRIDSKILVRIKDWLMKNKPETGDLQLGEIVSFVEECLHKNVVH